MLKKLLLAALCCGMFSSSAFADTCLNTDKDKYGTNDNRHSDYGKCKDSTPTDTYGAVGAIGKQMQGMLERNDDSGSSYHRELSSADLDDLYARDRKRFAQAPYAIRCEVESCNKEDWPQLYANADIPAAQQQAIRDEIKAAAAQGKLLDTYANDSFAKKWTSGSDPAANWKMCEVSASLVRAYVYGQGVTPEQKDPRKGFAIARAGCDASCGGACYELGRILLVGDAAAPGVDSYLGKEPEVRTKAALERAVRNGVTAAYETLAQANTVTPERYLGKTYINFMELDTDYYWVTGDTDQRLAYRQYQKCLKADPANLNCARGINQLLKDVSPSSGHNFALKGDVTLEDIAFYKDYQKKLEDLLAAQNGAH